MKFVALVVAVTMVLVSFSSVLAGGPLIVKPWVFDPDGLGVSEAKWVTGEGLADAGKSNHALYLSKQAPTSANAAGGASIAISGELTELGFDYRNDGHCGAGAPRFNVYTEAGTFFFGCSHGTSTPSAEDANWTRVRFSDDDAFPAGWPGFGNVEITGIDIVFDEGEDAGAGFVYLDNIDVNGVLVGKPGNAK